jgi:rubrerythrin
MEEFPLMRPEELLAHAIAIEHEAAARYAEFGERLRDLGDTDVGELFQSLSHEDLELEFELKARGARYALPPVPRAEHAWLDSATPRAGAHGPVFRLLTGHGALRIAREAEQHALEFFEHAAADAEDPGTALLACMLAEDERLRLRRVERLLARTPDPLEDWVCMLS